MRPTWKPVLTSDLAQKVLGTGSLAVMTEMLERPELFSSRRPEGILGHLVRDDYDSDPWDYRRNSPRGWYTPRWDAAMVNTPQALVALDALCEVNLQSSETTIGLRSWFDSSGCRGWPRD